MPKPIPFQVHESLEEAAYQSEEAGNGLGPDLRRAAIDVVERPEFNMVERLGIALKNADAKREQAAREEASVSDLDKRAWDCYLGDREDIETARSSRSGK